MKDTSNKKKKRTFDLLIIVLLVSTLGMYFQFLFYSKDIGKMVVEREIEQIDLISKYIRKIVHIEIEDCISVLQAGAEMLYGEESDRPLEEKAEMLQIIKEQTDFKLVGMIHPNGQAMNDSGEIWNLKDEALVSAINRNEIYISDILTSGQKKLGKILIAVPYEKEGKVVGAIWGRYPIDMIAKKVRETGDLERNFYIVDDQGRYISRSTDMENWNSSKTIWEDLTMGEFFHGETMENLRRLVESHESGVFNFKLPDGEIRYATYEPLEINNWYIFSVLSGRSPERYAEEIRKLSLKLIAGFTMFLAILFLAVYSVVYRGKRTIEMKNEQLEIKTKLFRMIMGSSKTIPFEISIKNKCIKIYHEEDENHDFMLLEDFSPEYMLEQGKIHKEDLESYQTLYELIVNGKEPDSIVIEMDLGDGWFWSRMHFLTVNDDVVIGYLENYEEQLKKNRELEAVNQKTKYDALTGLYNRETFVNLVNSKLEWRQDKMAALFLLDLDHFKEINDNLGHIMGDQVLVEMTQKLKNTLRSGDLSGRIGGDEFMVFIDDASDRASILKCAKKLNRALAKTYEKDGIKVCVSASIGIAVAEEGMTFNELYEFADKALYEVKNRSRNSCYIAN